MFNHISQMTVEIKPFFISVGVLLLTELLASVILSTDMIPQMLVIGAVRVLQINLFLVIFIIWGNGLSSLGLAQDQLLSGLWRGLLWSAAFGIVVSLGLGILFFYGQSPSTLIHTRFPEQTGGELLLFLFVGGFAGLCCGRNFFRGILYGFLRRPGHIHCSFSDYADICPPPSCQWSDTDSGRNSVCHCL